VRGLLKNEITNLLKQKADMDVPLAPYNIGIRYGLKGIIGRRSSTFSHQADVVGLFAIFGVSGFTQKASGKLNFSG
jgi:hypothetical protein